MTVVMFFVCNFFFWGFQGALCGLVMALIFSIYLGFGQPRPPPQTLSFSVDDCTEFEGMEFWSNRTVQAAATPKLESVVETK